MQLAEQEVMSEPSAGDSGLWEGESGSKPIHSSKWFTHVTQPRTNLMLFFAIEKFGEKVVSCLSLRAEDEFFSELKNIYYNC